MAFMIPAYWAKKDSVKKYTSEECSAISLRACSSEEPTKREEEALEGVYPIVIPRGSSPFMHSFTDELLDDLEIQYVYMKKTLPDGKRDDIMFPVPVPEKYLEDEEIRPDSLRRIAFSNLKSNIQVYDMLDFSDALCIEQEGHPVNALIATAGFLQALSLSLKMDEFLISSPYYDEIIVLPLKDGLDQSLSDKSGIVPRFISELTHYTSSENGEPLWVYYYNNNQNTISKFM